jgi:elongation factor P
MITASDFRKGVTFEMDGNIYVIVDFMHVKPGKGSPFVRAKIKNIITGQVQERTFTPSDKFQVAVIERKEMQYLYNEGDIYFFMDMETYDQIPIDKSKVEDALNFMTENMTATIQFYKGVPFSVEPPLFVELLITDCEPGIQGDTSKASYKPATLETGFTVGVPLFVNQGEKIRVDTRTGTYMERVK